MNKISVFSFPCLLRWFLECGSNCPLPGLWLAPPVAPSCVSLPFVGFLVIWPVLENPEDRKEPVWSVQSLLGLSTKGISNNFLKICDGEWGCQEKWWPRRAPIAWGVAVREGLDWLSGWECGFPHQSDLGCNPVWHWESYLASLGLFSLYKIGIIIALWRVILRITWENVGKVLNRVPETGQVLSRRHLSPMIKVMNLRAGRTLEIICPPFPLTAEQRSTVTGPADDTTSVKGRSPDS